MKVIITNNRLLIFSHGWCQFMMSTLYRNLLINISWSTVYIMYNTETTVEKYTLLSIKSSNRIYWLSNQIYWLSNHPIIHSNWLVLFIKSSNQITHCPQIPFKTYFNFAFHTISMRNIFVLVIVYSCLICVSPSSLSKITMTQILHTKYTWCNRQ